MRNDNKKKIEKQRKKFKNYTKCANKLRNNRSSKGYELGEKINTNQQKHINLFAFINACLINKKKKSSKRNKR